MQESHSSTSKYIKQNFTYQKGERDKFTILAGNFNTPLLIFLGQKIEN